MVYLAARKGTKICENIEGHQSLDGAGVRDETKPTKKISKLMVCNIFFSNLDIKLFIPNSSG